MASIKTILRGYICDEREQNWSKEFASREIARHKEKRIIDHPDKSISAEKLMDASITEDKLSESVLSKIITSSAEIESLKISLNNEITGRKNADELKADKNDVYTKLEHEESVGRVIDGIVFPAIAKKADKDDVYLKDEIDLRLGDVDLALDRIIEIQNSFMPGGIPGEPNVPGGDV